MNNNCFFGLAVDYILMDPSERQRLHIKEIPKPFPQRYLIHWIDFVSTNEY